MNCFIHHFSLAFKRSNCLVLSLDFSPNMKEAISVGGIARPKQSINLLFHLVIPTGQKHYSPSYYTCILIIIDCVYQGCKEYFNLININVNTD